ncbi:MAG: hypothetical protein JWM80_3673 [Cyanobacteria bacterium RYN_339]|nr:hypothetical protein [Cyanobacteria bacterium RYN_339]
MSRIDSYIEHRFDGVRQDARYRPIIDRAKQAATAQGATTDSVLAAAVSVARDQFQGSTDDSLREAALASAMAARIESPFGLSDLPAGTDKTEHFLVSAMIGLKVTHALDHVLPRGIAAWLGEHAAKAVGVAKEGLDFVTHSDFGKTDITADFKGAELGPRFTVTRVAPRLKVTP